jgi:hypothetical protein
MTRTRRFTALLVVAVVCVVASPTSGGPAVAGLVAAGPDDPARTAAQTESPPDPADDTIGWEQGYWHNESIDVSQTDGEGLSGAERRRLLARSMARVEQMRGLEFTENVSLRFVSRQEFRRGFRNHSLPADLSTEQLYGTFTLPDGFWEAVFFYGEETDARQRILSIYAGSVIGYSAEEGFENEVIIVTRDPDAPTVGPNVLVHELAHALQGQHFDLDEPRYHPDTHDGRLGKDGIVEGEAAYLGYQYRQQCDSQWDCVDVPGNWSGTVNHPDRAHPLLTFQPYSDGRVLVHDVVQQEGWSGVDALHERVPQTSSEVVDGRATPEERDSVAVEDASTDAWQVAARERVGEATVFMMFWKQAVDRDPDAIDPDLLGAVRSEYDVYNYASEPSRGWVDDEVVLYEAGDETGYVWKTAWESGDDAAEFASAYRTLLESHGAEPRGQHTWVVPDDSEFGDAFHVVRDGRTVRVANAPTVDRLSTVDGGITIGESTTSEPPDSTTTTAAPLTTTTMEPTDASPGSGEDGADPGATTDDTTPRDSTADASGPGFTLPLALLGLLVMLGGRYRRSG